MSVGGLKKMLHKSLLAERDQEIGRLRRELDRIGAQAAEAYDAGRESLESEISSLRADLQRSRSQVDEMLRANEEQDAEMERVRIERDDLHLGVRQAIRERDEARAEVERLTRGRDARTVERDSARASMTNHFANYEEQRQWAERLREEARSIAEEAESYHFTRGMPPEAATSALKSVAQRLRALAASDAPGTEAPMVGEDLSRSLREMTARPASQPAESEEER